MLKAQAASSMLLVLKCLLSPLPSYPMSCLGGAEGLTSARVMSAQAFLASCGESGHQGGCGVG